MKRLWIALGLLCFCLALSIGALFWQRTTVKGLQEKLNMIDSTESATVFFDACTDAGEILALFGPHANSEDLLQSAATLPILLANSPSVPNFSLILPLTLE